eukprot:jgi/Mesen1/776/ME000110S_11041
MGLSRALTALANSIIMLAGIGILGTGIWLKTKHGAAECVKFLQWPIIILGVVIFVIALVGFVGAVNGMPSLLLCYLICMFVTMLLLLAFTVFAFLVTNAKAGQVASGRGFKEYKTADFSGWLRNRVESGGNWKKIRACIYDLDTCHSLDKYSNYTSLMAAHLSPIQSNNTDCSSYSNESTGLCYGCDSCKAGVLKSVRDDWRKVAIVNVVAFIAVLVVYTVGCCAYRSSKRGYSKGFGV